MRSQKLRRQKSLAESDVSGATSMCPAMVEDEEDADRECVCIIVILVSWKLGMSFM
jgi:hypothetical protein